MFQYSEFKEFLDDKKSTKTTNSKKTVIKSFSGFQQNQVSVSYTHLTLPTNREV